MCQDLVQKRKVKKVNTFVANLSELCPNFLKRPVLPRLLQKVWDFFVMMIDVEGKAIGEALSRKKLKLKGDKNWRSGILILDRLLQKNKVT